MLWLRNDEIFIYNFQRISSVNKYIYNMYMEAKGTASIFTAIFHESTDRR